MNEKQLSALENYIEILVSLRVMEGSVPEGMTTARIEMLKDDMKDAKEIYRDVLRDVLVGVFE